MKPGYVSGSLAMSHAMMMSTCRPDMHAGHTAIFGTRHPVGCMMAADSMGKWLDQVLVPKWLRTQHMHLPLENLGKPTPN